VDEFIGNKHTYQQTDTQLYILVQKLMKKALRKMQTLRAGCSKAEPKIFALPQTSFPGAREGQNLIS